MAGFNWNQFYTIFKTKMEKAVTCTVGRYITPKTTQLPYCDVAIEDISGGTYDLTGHEHSVTPLITITAYATGSLADNTCETISAAAKEIMLSYGFQCKTGAIPVVNTEDPTIIRWVARYQRVFAVGDGLEPVN